MTYESVDPFFQNLNESGARVREFSKEEFHFSENINNMINKDFFDETIRKLSLGYKNELKIEKERMVIYKYKIGEKINICNFENSKMLEYIDHNNLSYRNTATIIVFLPPSQPHSFTLLLSYNNITEKRQSITLNHNHLSFLSFFDPSNVELISEREETNNHNESNNRNENYLVCAYFKVNFFGKLFPRPSEHLKSIFEIPSLLRCWRRLVYDHKMVKPNSRRSQLIVLQSGNYSPNNYLQQFLQNLSIISIREKTRIIISDINLTQKGPAVLKSPHSFNPEWENDPSYYDMRATEVFFLKQFI